MRFALAPFTTSRAHGGKTSRLQDFMVLTNGTAKLEDAAPARPQSMAEKFLALAKLNAGGFKDGRKT